MANEKRLIELLKLSPSCICDLCGENGRFDEVAEIIADNLIANGVTIQKWIPVTERLPEELKNVLAYTDVGSFAETAHWTGYRWEKTWDFEVLYGVTHWMPLPEAPNGERRTE